MIFFKKKFDFFAGEIIFIPHNFLGFYMDKKLRELKRALDNLSSSYEEVPHYGGYVYSHHSKNNLDREIARRIEIALKKKGVVVR